MLKLVKGAALRGTGDEPGAARALDEARAADDLAPLARAARDGAPEATRTLVMAVGPAVLKVVRRVLGAHHPEVEDVAQESVFAFLGGLPTFRGACTTLHFACRVAVLTALKARRRAGARGAGAETVPADEALADGEEGRSPLAQAIAARRRQVLRALLRELPEAQAEALTMHVLLGYSVEEIGAAAGVPANTVRSRLRLGKEALRARVAADGALDEMLRDQGEEAP